ncbi:MAG TPA: SUMF1/EgtB/PvdO family nonheme iron enzyme [Blastocatellia bacterium]|nr:SUMF1/EgtB/PvdO family nonheme iron enzyme [Blastocatellia bacterium]
MYCDRCNVEFTDGLRYCKWCGQALADRPRVTSELHACPNCTAAVQPGWIFCKSCGVRLAAPVSDPGRVFCPKCGAGAEATAASCARCGTSLAPEPAPSTHEGHSTSVIGGCSSCGEKLDTGSMYCKACGAAVYAQARPFGGSALLCSACNSYSPVGSTVCRVCGASLSAGDDSPTVAIGQQKPTTLPDLPALAHHDDQELTDPDQVNSGANTAIFSATGEGADPTTALAESGRETGLVGEKRTGGPGTNALPGVAGSKSEFPAQTARVPKTRITSPVESDTPDEPPSSGKLPGGESETVIMNSPFAETPVESQALPLVAPDNASDQAPVSSESPRRKAGPYPTREQVSTTPFAEGRPASDTQATPDIEAVSQSAPLDQPQLQPKKRSGVAIASVAVALIVIAGAGYLVWSFLAQKGPSQRPPVVESKPIEPPAPPPAPPPPAIPPGMVMVKAGTYTIGRDDGDPIEAPGHPVTLAAYYIDRVEVTNAEYAKFVQATRHKPPANWKDGSIPAGRDDFPVTGVSWQDAADYASWAGKRLPTEAEWEAAARGGEARKYSWGNEWQSGFANIGLKTTEKEDAARYPSGIAEGGKYPQGASPSGALDMIGNVWEWVADELSLYPGSSATLPVPADDAVGTLRVIRGGAYDGNQRHDASYRGFLDGSLPYPKVGFRCVKSAGQ